MCSSDLTAPFSGFSIVELVIENPLNGAVRLVEAPISATGPIEVSSWATTNECNDGAYSHLGGQPAACASDFGEFRPLWAS